jgi:hypothetical protein
MYNYISTHGWDSTLKCWREATTSDRIVLFANTWMSYYLFQKGEAQKGLDAMSLTGKVLYTNGNGELHGMDGIVPLAIWYEGTLSYISAGGPGSISLFEEIRTHINPDGMVSHYNESLGGIGGIWAEDWHSLDGTSWLYFTTSGKSPFDVLEGIPVGINLQPAKQGSKHFSITNSQTGELKITPLIPIWKAVTVRVYQSDGRLLAERKVPANSVESTISVPFNNRCGKVVLVQIIGFEEKEYYPISVN